jgi:hypothetical protein
MVSGICVLATASSLLSYEQCGGEQTGLGLEANLCAAQCEW